MANRAQRTFASLGFDVKRRVTRREHFLSQMDRAMPWSELEALIEPYYPKEGGPGRPVTPLLRMIKVYFLQIWFSLSDPGTEELIYDSYSVQRFLELDLGKEGAPDETTILRFRHLIEKHGLGPKLLAVVNKHLKQRGIRIETGTIVDATIIHAPSSTKNSRQSRDPQMGSTKKGEQWHFGAKLHVGVDSQTKVIHSVEVTSASVHDSQVVSKLVHGGENRVYGDRAYVGQQAAIRSRAPQARCFVEQRVHAKGVPEEVTRRKNRWKARIRCRVEHVFGVIKHRFGWRKVRFRGIYKNLTYAFSLAASVNIYMHRKVFGEPSAALSLS